MINPSSVMPFNGVNGSKKNIVLTENVARSARSSWSRSSRNSSAYDFNNCLDGNRNGQRYAHGNWATHWEAVAPHWAQVNFSRICSVKQIRVYGLRDNADVDAGNSINDNEEMLSTQFTWVSFIVESLKDGVWQQVASVNGNDKVLVVIDLPAFESEAIRLVTVQTKGGCRLCELEVWE